MAMWHYNAWAINMLGWVVAAQPGASVSSYAHPVVSLIALQIRSCIVGSSDLGAAGSSGRYRGPGTCHDHIKGRIGSSPLIIALGMNVTRIRTLAQIPRLTLPSTLLLTLILT